MILPPDAGEGGEMRGLFMAGKTGTYMVRQPIVDQKQKVVAYEILYHEDVNVAYNQKEASAANAVSELLTQLGNETYLDGKKVFITFTPNLLMQNVPRMFASTSLIIQIEDNVLVHPLAQKIIYRYKAQGYPIAIRGFEFNSRYFSMLDVVDYIKIDLRSMSNPSLPNIVNMAKSFKKQVIGYNIDTPEALQFATKIGCDLLQGSCVAEGNVSNVHRMDHMQSNFFRLVMTVTKDEPDLDEIAEIISRDATLAFSLMKLVNSAYFALRNRAKSIHQALVILGIGQLKQWIYLLSFNHDAGTVSEELLKTSFLRASFCQELSQYIPNFPISKSEAYLMGMFSTLGTLMQVPLDMALSELSLSEEVKAALLTGEGMCGALYHLVLCYEKADWTGVVTNVGALNIPVDMITQIYFECVEQVNQIWVSLTAPSTEEESTGKPDFSDATEKLAHP